ncbi:MAG: hypothetical protein AAB319_11435 [Pseudomonadota bacterium]
MKYLLMLVAVLAVLAGCNNKPKNQAQPLQIIQEQKQALDQAKGVGDTLAKQAEEQKKQIDEAAK